MSITVTVMYPNEPGSTFDMDYYLGSHGPMVQDRWGAFGLKALKLMKGAGTPDPDTPPPYQVIAMLSFDRLEDFQGAVGAHGAEVMGDIANFTSVQPVIQISQDLS